MSRNHLSFFLTSQHPSNFNPWAAGGGPNIYHHLLVCLSLSLRICTIITPNTLLNTIFLLILVCCQAQGCAPGPRSPEFRPGHRLLVIVPPYACFPTNTTLEQDITFLVFRMDALAQVVTGLESSSQQVYSNCGSPACTTNY